MRFLFLLLTSVLLFSSSIRAEKISQDKALELAKAFMLKNVKNQAARNAVSNEMTILAEKTDGHYVFNFAHNNGFIIIAGDDIVSDPVLGYCDNGTFDKSLMPENMKWWLQEYDRQIIHMQQHKEAYATKEEAGEENDNTTYAYSEISPLMKTRWSQSSPYNDKCPVINGKKSPTGCVATALAQILKYNRWPEKGFGSYKGTDFSSITFDWDNMTDTYSYKSSEESKDAVATLMSAIGIAVDMMYGESSSGAYTYTACRGIRENFGYSEVKLINRDELSQASWDDYLYSELSHNRPVFYTGCTESGSGHAFVCDGYKDGLFHINWGWGGTADGYFKTTALKPSVQGTGGSDGGYNYLQGIISNLFNPNDESQKYTYAITERSLTLGNDKPSESNELTINGKIKTDTNESKFSYGIKVVDEKNNETFIKEDKQRVSFGYTDFTYSFTVKLDDFPVADGTYNIYPMVYGEDSKSLYGILSAYENKNMGFHATVKDGSITFKNETISNIEISDVEIPTFMYQNKTATIKTKIKCTSGLVFRKKLYVGFRSKGDTDPVLCDQANKPDAIPEGTTKDIEISVKPPTKIQEYDVALFMMQEGELKQLTDYYTTSVIEQKAVLRITAALTLPQKDYTAVDPDNFKLNATIKCTEKDFNGELRFYVFDKETDEEICYVKTDLELKNGWSTKVPFVGVLTGVNGGQLYYGKVYHEYAKDKWTPVDSNIKSGTPANYILFKTADTSSIDGVTDNTQTADDTTYTISGQKTTNSQSGIYITRRNGKFIKVCK